MKARLAALLCIAFLPTLIAAQPASPVLVPGDDDRAVLEPFFDAATLDSLDSREKAVLAEAARDPRWADENSFYLSQLHDPPITDWSLLSDPHKGRVLREWARLRLDALDAVRDARLSSRPTEEQARHIRLLAAAGFLTPSELAALRPLKAPSGGAFLADSSALPGDTPEAARAFAAQPFTGEAAAPAPLGEGSVPAELVPAQPAPGPEVAYAALKSMILDPEAFAQSRPELFAADDGNGTARERLRQQLGHLFETADRLRAQGRLLLEAGPLTEPGPALGGIARVVLEAPSPEGTHWTFALRVKDGYFNEDPALLAPILAHELQHVYDLDRVLERFGPEAARALADCAEEEERAFAAQELVDAAYAGPLATAYELRKTPPAWLVFTSHKKLVELAALREQDPLDHLAALKELAASDLRGRLPGHAWRDLDTLEKDAESDAAGLSKQEADASGEHLDYLRRELKRDQALLKAIAQEKSRGLSLT